MEQYPCEECGKPVLADLKTRRYLNGIEENYIQCPHCKTEFIAYVTDQWARNEQKKIKKLHEEYWKRRNKLSVRLSKLKQDVIDKKEALETIRPVTTKLGIGDLESKAFIDEMAKIKKEDEQKTSE